jgi:hypothetical protein
VATGPFLAGADQAFLFLLAFSYSYLFSCSRNYMILGKLSSKISMVDLMDVEMGFTTPGLST